MMWSDLSSGWKAVFNELWNAYSHGMNPIGAAICDENGHVLVSAHNAIDGEDCDMPIHGHDLAHAEINAILLLGDWRKHPQIKHYKLYTSLEPCPLCFGAIVMGSIRSVAYAMRDKVGGASGINDSIDYIRAKQIKLDGPVPELEPILCAIKTCYACELTSYKALEIRLKAYGDIHQGACALGQQMAREGTLRQIAASGDGVSMVYDKIAKLLN